jgi:hypothetical protein
VKRFAFLVRRFIYTANDQVVTSGLGACGYARLGWSLSLMVGFVGACGRGAMMIGLNNVYNESNAGCGH